MEEQKQILIGIDYSLMSEEVIEILIEDVADPEVYAEIARANLQRPEIMKLLLAHTDVPDGVRHLIAEHLKLPVVPKRELVVHQGMNEEKKRETITSKVQKLNVSARIQLALKGGREIRGILTRDSNKEVSLSVLDNPRITETEIEMICKSRSTIEEALRRISKNREWTKNYAIVIGLVTNPKTPAGIAVTYVSGLKGKDLSVLEKNKNVAEVVRTAAKRVLQARRPQ